MTPETHGYLQDVGSQPYPHKFAPPPNWVTPEIPRGFFVSTSRLPSTPMEEGLAQVLRVTLEVIMVCLINAKQKQLNKIPGQIKQEHTHGGECSTHYHRWILLLLLQVRIVRDIRYMDCFTKQESKPRPGSQCLRNHLKQRGRKQERGHLQPSFLLVIHSCILL